jgi:hypothetical protein
MSNNIVTSSSVASALKYEKFSFSKSHARLSYDPATGQELKVEYSSVGSLFLRLCNRLAQIFGQPSITQQNLSNCLDSAITYVNSRYTKEYLTKEDCNKIQEVLDTIKTYPNLVSHPQVGAKLKTFEDNISKVLEEETLAVLVSDRLGKFINWQILPGNIKSATSYFDKLSTKDISNLNRELGIKECCLALDDISKIRDSYKTKLADPCNNNTNNSLDSLEKWILNKLDELKKDLPYFIKKLPPSLYGLLGTKVIHLDNLSTCARHATRFLEELKKLTQKTNIKKLTQETNPTSLNLQIETLKSELELFRLIIDEFSKIQQVIGGKQELLKQQGIKEFSTCFQNFSNFKTDRLYQVFKFVRTNPKFVRTNPILEDVKENLCQSIFGRSLNSQARIT